MQPFLSQFGSVQFVDMQFFDMQFGSAQVGFSPLGLAQLALPSTDPFAGAAALPALALPALAFAAIIAVGASLVVIHDSVARIVAARTERGGVRRRRGRVRVSTAAGASAVVLRAWRRVGAPAGARGRGAPAARSRVSQRVRDRQHRAAGDRVVAVRRS